MLSRSIRLHRRLPAALLSVTMALVTTGGLAVDAETASADGGTIAQAESENWAGYVAKSGAGSSFSTVSASWIQPTVTSSSSSTSGYSAFWVGLGGSISESGSLGSGSLEQTGTAGEWVNGQAVYYAWYELLPAAQVKLDLAIHAGDHVSASVTVEGSSVTLHLVDETTGGSVTKTLTMSNPDTSSAEWIAEAPATQSESGDYQVVPLANFGTVTFTGASATAGGHTGPISDSDWTAQRVNLVSGDGADVYPGGQGLDPATPVSASGASAAASASTLTSDGSSFSVSYQASSGSGASQDYSPQGVDSGSGGYGADGYGGYGAGGYGGYGDSGYGGYGNGDGGYADDGSGYGGYGDGGYGLPGFLQ